MQRASLLSSSAQGELYFENQDMALPATSLQGGPEDDKHCGAALPGAGGLGMKEAGEGPHLLAGTPQFIPQFPSPTARLCYQGRCQLPFGRPDSGLCASWPSARILSTSYYHAPIEYVRALFDR